MYERPILQELRKRMLESRRFIQVVTGPRQTGKTTMIGQLIRQLPFSSLYVSADDIPAADRTWISQSWNEARLKLAGSTSGEFLLVIDEIQKIDKWSEAVKKEWDADMMQDRNLKVILSGSSRLLIQKGLTESLAGRFEILPQTHWSYTEMKEAFGWDVNAYIWFGGYPGSARLTGEETRWKTYIKESMIETSLSRDVLMLTRVDKPALLKRLFEVGCAWSSQIVSLNKIQGELQESGNLTTLSKYLHLLTGAGLLTGLEKYAGSTLRQRSSKPKFQVFNNALLSALSPARFPDITKDHRQWGRLVESAVGAHLLNSAVSNRFQLWYWNESHHEVDYIISGNGKLAAIEVKSGKESVNKGLSLFSERFRPNYLYTVGTGGIPVEEFLSTDPYQLLNL